MNNFISAFSLPRNLRQLFIRPPGNYAALDGLRAISVLSVVIYHCFLASDFIGGLTLFQRLHDNIPGWMRWVWQGPLGVDTFFVISGFLIGTMLMKELRQTHAVSFKTFYVRRLLRLTPVYYLSLILIDLGLTQGSPPENASLLAYLNFALLDDYPAHMWRNYLYIPNFFPLAENNLAYTWSLAVEEQFYLVFPLFLFLFYRQSKRPLTLLVSIFAASFFIRWAILIQKDYYSALMETGNQLTERARDWNARYFETLYDNLYSHYGSIMCGVIAAHLNLHHRSALTQFFSSQKLPAAALLLLSLFTIGFIYQTTIPSPFVDYSAPLQSVVIVSFQNVFCAAVAYLMLACFYGQDLLSRFINGFFSLRLWYPIAQLSYSIYLFHFILVIIIASANKRIYDAVIASGGLITEWHIWKLVLQASVVSIIMATLMYLVLERPIMNLRQSAPAEPNKD